MPSIRCRCRPSATHDAATAAQSPAVALLVARAKAAIPGFELDDHNAAAVAEIVRRLDGLPLALELAAIRMRAISPDDLASRLTWRFRLLRQGVRTAPGRHQTLEAVVRWSYELLDETDQMVLGTDLRVLRQLQPGARRGTRPRSNRCLPQDWEPGEVAGLVLSLADRSMVVTVSAGASKRAWRLLETIRAYGRERLGERRTPTPSPTCMPSSSRHATAEAHQELFGPRHSEATEMVEAEFDDLRAAVRGRSSTTSDSGARSSAGSSPTASTGCRSSHWIGPSGSSRTSNEAWRAPRPPRPRLRRRRLVRTVRRRTGLRRESDRPRAGPGRTDDITEAHLRYLRAEVACSVVGSTRVSACLAAVLGSARHAGIRP